jgi:hypothetical protein
MITEPVPVPPQDTPKPRRSRQSARTLRQASRGKPSRPSTARWRTSGLLPGSFRDILAHKPLVRSDALRVLTCPVPLY